MLFLDKLFDVGSITKEESVRGGNVTTLGDEVADIIKFCNAGIFIAHWSGEVSGLAFVYYAFNLVEVLRHENKLFIRALIHHIDARAGFSAAAEGIAYFYDHK